MSLSLRDIPANPITLSDACRALQRIREYLTGISGVVGGLAGGRVVDSGFVTLPGGSPNVIAVMTTQVAADSRILLTLRNPGSGSGGSVYAASTDVMAGAYFYVNCDDSANNSEYAWAVIAPPA